MRDVHCLEDPVARGLPAYSRLRFELKSTLKSSLSKFAMKNVFHSATAGHC